MITEGYPPRSVKKQRQLSKISQERSMAPVIAALVAGTALALIGLVIAFIGYRKLKKSIFKTSIAGENV